MAISKKVPAKSATGAQKIAGKKAAAKKAPAKRNGEPAGLACFKGAGDLQPSPKDTKGNK